MGVFKNRNAPVLERFMQFVNKTETCWLWVGARRNHGPIQGAKYLYGRFSLNRKRECAHRIAWTLFVGPIPKNCYVLHSCDVPLCVNPRHLFLGTQLDNVLDRNSKGRGWGQINWRSV